MESLLQIPSSASEDIISLYPSTGFPIDLFRREHWAWEMPLINTLMVQDRSDDDRNAVLQAVKDVDAPFAPLLLPQRWFVDL